MLTLFNHSFLMGETLTINANDKAIPLGKHLRYLEDPTGEMLPEKFFKSEESLSLVKSTTDAPSFGLTSSVFWFVVDIAYKGDLNQNYIIELYPSYLDEVDIYWIKDGQIEIHQVHGDLKNFSTRIIKHRNFISRMQLKTDDNFRLLIRVRTNAALLLEPKLSLETYFWEHDTHEIAIHFIYFGIMLVMSLYNALIYFTIRQRSYLYYVLYTTTLTLFQACYLGLDYQYFWPDQSFIHERSILFFVGLSNWSLIYFSLSFLNINQTMPQFANVMKSTAVFSLFMCLVCFFVSPNISIKLLTLLGILTCLMCITSGIWRVKQGDSAAIYYLLAFFMYVICAVLFGLLNLNILPKMFITNYGLQIGSASQVVLFSFALARWFKGLQEQNIEIQKKMNQQLKEREKARTLFFNNTSHELRTPLNGIIGFLELVVKNRYGEIPEKATEQLNKTIRLAQSLTLQVNTILDLAKSQRGELKVQIQQFSLRELKDDIDALAEGLNLKASNASYESRLNTDNDRFIGDKNKVYAIIRNLIGNAFKFGAVNRPNKVMVVLKVDKTGFSLRVSDTGIGIAPEDHGKIFEEFRQLQSDARRTYEGTGLGLKMVNDYVTVMGGEIALDSSLDRGTVLEVRLPAKSEQDLSIFDQYEQEAINSAEMIKFSQNGKSNRFTDDIEAAPRGGDTAIFVIDDHETNCEVIVEILKIDGYQVHYACSGLEGIESMRKQTPDLLLLDMMMPEISGEDVIKTMRNDPVLQEVPIIVITARASDEDRILGLKLGADDYLSKPIYASELRLRVRNMTERRRLLQVAEQSVHQDKLLQLGEMFQDLSHELKNKLQGTSALVRLEPEDGRLSMAGMRLPVDEKNALAEALVGKFNDYDKIEREKGLDLGNQRDEGRKVRRHIRSNLVELDLSMEHLTSIWLQVKQSPLDEIKYLESQLKLFVQYQNMKYGLQECLDLAQSVLSYTRRDCHVQKSDLVKSWRHTMILIDPRARKIGVSWDISIPEMEVRISPSSLTQVLVNLGINAIDAISSLGSEEKWIQVQAKQSSSEVIIEIANGGLRIPTLLSKKLFDRGFSTKGEMGSGIGLYVCQRLINAAGGTIAYDEDSKHPLFRITLPFTMEENSKGGLT